MKERLMMPSPSPHQKVESRLGRSLLRPLVKDSDKPELQQLKAMAIEKERSRKVLSARQNTTIPTPKPRRSLNIGQQNKSELISTAADGHQQEEDSRDENLNDSSLSVTEENTTTSDLSKYFDKSSPTSRPATTTDTGRSSSTVKDTAGAALPHQSISQISQDSEMDKSLLSQSPVITDRTTKLLRRQLMSDATQTDLPPMDKNNVSVMTEELNRLEGIRLTLEHYHALQWKALQLRQQQEKDRLETQIATLHEAITRQSLVENNFETGGDTTPTVENSQTENFFNHFRHDAITYDGDVNNARINSSTPTKNQLSPSTQTIRRPPLETSPLATPQKCSPRTKRSSISPTKVSHSLNVLKRRLPQLVRGYLTRRIMNTEKIRGICTLITETVRQMSSLEYQTESTGQPMDDYDEILYCQLDVQVKAAKSELYSLLFEVPMGQRLALLERQREIDRFHSVKQASEKPKKRLSSATMKSLERKQRQNSLCREFEPKPSNPGKKRSHSSLHDMKRPQTQQSIANSPPRRIGSASSRRSLPTYSPRKYFLKRNPVSQVMKQNRPSSVVHSVVNDFSRLSIRPSTISSRLCKTCNRLHGTSDQICNPLVNLTFCSGKSEPNKQKPWKGFFDSNKMNFKKLTSDASNVFSRAMQLTGEKFGTAEKTEFDGRLEALLQRSERTEEHTKKILAAIEAYLQPNPTARVEDFFSEKFQINKDASRLNNLESFGQVLTDASNALGPSTEYGDTLAKVSSIQFQIGAAEREMVQSAIVNTIAPLKRFLEGEMKNINKEKKVLMTKRLNLDSCKSRLKKARNTEGEAAKGGQSIDQIEAELKILTNDFEKQVEIVTILLNELDKAHKNHQRCLQDFIDAQLNFFARSHQHLADLQRQIQSGYGVTNNSAVVANSAALPPGLSGGSQTLANWTDSGTRRAKVVFDYDAISGNELSIKRMDELIVYKLPGLDAEFVMAEKGNQRGRVPISYLEIIP